MTLQWQRLKAHWVVLNRSHCCEFDEAADQRAERHTKRHICGAVVGRSVTGGYLFKSRFFDFPVYRFTIHPAGKLLLYFDHYSNIPPSFTL